MKIQLLMNLYEVPLMLENNGLAVQVCKKLNLDKIEPNNGQMDWTCW